MLATPATDNTSQAALCRYFNQLPSGCLKGDSCPYRHVTIDVDTTTAQLATTTLSKKNKSTEKPTVCRYYRRNQSCYRGDRCHFLHATKDTPTASTGSSERSLMERTITQQLKAHYGKQFKGLIQGDPKKDQNNKHSDIPENNTVTAHLCLIPTDPDFSFDLEELELSLAITTVRKNKHNKQADQQDSHPYELRLRILNKDIPFGIARNVEVSFQHHVRKNPKNPICTQLDWLRDQLEQLLRLPTASNFTFVASQPVEALPATTVVGQPSVPVTISRPAKTTTNFNAKGSEKGGEKRQFELKQIERRFRTTFEWLKSSDINHGHNEPLADRFQLMITPTDPDYRHPYSPIQLQIMLPLDYPDSPMKLRITSRELPRDKARTVEHAFHEHLKQQGRALSILHALNWLDRQLNDLLSLPGRAEEDTEHEEEKEVKEKEVDVVAKMATLTVSKDQRNIKQSEKVKVSKPSTQQHYKNKDEDVKGEEHDTDSDDSDTPAELVDTFTTSIRRGTEIKWIKGERKGIDFLRCTLLNLSSTAVDATTGGEKRVACGVCHHVMGIRYRADAIHDGSVTMGYLDLEGCRVADMLPCSFAVTCSGCSLEQTPAALSDLPRGQPTTVFCRGCHQPLTLNIDQIKFQRLTMGGISSTTENSDAIETVGTLQRRQLLKDMVIDYAPGKPLPDHGTCKHYRRSHRWMRFPCCGKVYPCDTCHDTTESHDHERARRMICGYCSLEQPFGDKTCSCGAAMGRQKQHEFWEGGAGMRDRTQMNRRDPHKYKNTLKTVSRKKQQLA
ncbi:hypothetical protein BDF19DRAFT_444964 [Syncephalis fuscata]|nr:hypothetical protein BDF19DRAFT_444964 [Syncephalis fuscata]